MAVNSVSICNKCKQAFVNGEITCPNCGSPLIITRFSSIYWGKCNDEERKANMEEYISDVPLENSKSTSDVQLDESKVSTIGPAIKILSAIYIILTGIGSLYIMDQLGFRFGAIALFMSFLIGLLVYGIGEICHLLAQINAKMDRLIK